MKNSIMLTLGAAVGGAAAAKASDATASIDDRGVYRALWTEAMRRSALDGALREAPITRFRFNGPPLSFTLTSTATTRPQRLALATTPTRAR